MRYLYRGFPAPDLTPLAASVWPLSQSGELEGLPRQREASWVRCVSGLADWRRSRIANRCATCIEASRHRI